MQFVTRPVTARLWPGDISGVNPAGGSRRAAGLFSPRFFILSYTNPASNGYYYVEIKLSGAWLKGLLE
jgi:hypothetical protein